MTSTRTRRVAFVAGAVVLGIALAALRGYPWLTSDQGVFLSVAARMLDGDVLYADVVDNKDPLFFSTYALAMFAGGYRGPFALDALWFALSAVSIGLLVRELRASSSAVVCAAIVYPLALTASWYRPGLSMLGALALCPLAGWLWLRSRFVLAGVAVACVMLLKLNLGLLVIAPIAVFVAFGRPHQHPQTRVSQLGRAVVGFGGVATATAVALAVQGALDAYVEVIGNNVHYAGGRSWLDGVSGHLRIVSDTFADPGKWQLPLAVLFVAALGVATLVTLRRGGLASAALGIAALGALGAALVTLALTAIWSHHVQLLAYPAALGAAGIVSFAAAYGRWLGYAVATGCACFALWSTAKLEADGGLTLRQWTEDPFKVPSTELERARLRYFPGEERVSYMVFGSNSENAHAVFIDKAFDLSCRWFHLYPFNRPQLFDETMDCAVEQAPMLVLVTLGFESSGDGSAWASFVDRARRLLAAEYDLVGEAYPGFEVWKRKAPS